MLEAEWSPYPHTKNLQTFLSAMTLNPRTGPDTRKRYHLQTLGSSLPPFLIGEDDG